MAFSPKSGMTNLEKLSVTGGYYVGKWGEETQIINSSGSFVGPISPSSVELEDGTAASPSLRFENDLDTGVYRPTTNQLGISAGGTLALLVTTTHIQPAYPLRFPSGTAAAPSITFSAESTMGIYRSGSNGLGFSVAGAQVAQFNGTALELSGQFRASNGTAATPAISFTNDADTGLYRAGANQLGLSVGGAQRALFSTAATTVTLPFQAAAGSASAPSLSFSADSDTGLYNVSANTLGIATSGTLRVAVASTSLTFTPGTGVAFDIIRNNSSGSLRVSGGSSTSDSQAATILLTGNSAASNPGDLLLRAGNVSGGEIKFSTGGAQVGLVSDAGSWTLGATSTTPTHILNTSVATGATGGADTLPANPVGFITITINGTARKIPYYAT